MKNKLLFAILLLSVQLISQELDVSKRKYSYSYPKLSYYGFFDITRFAGIGVSYRIDESFGLDLSGGLVYPNGLTSGLVSANDYYYSSGAYISLLSKCYPSTRKHFFVGIYNSFQRYGYNKQWAETSLNYDKYAAYENYTELRDRRTTSFIILAPAIGFSGNTGPIYWEWFFSVSMEAENTDLTVYEDKLPYPTGRTYPYHESISHSDLAVVTGLKLGFASRIKNRISYKYYEQKFINLTKNDFYAIKTAKIKDSIPFQDYRDFKLYRKEVLRKVKPIWRKNKADDKKIEEEISKLILGVTDRAGKILGR